jgi:hypothetical protein
MSKRAWLVRSAFSGLALTMTIAPLPARAADPASAAEMAPQAVPEPAAEQERPAGFACAEKPVTGTGPGFDSSRDHSEETAKEAWLVKARAIYSDAAWDTAKELGMSCAKQGLFSKCFASAIPCGAKQAAAADAPKADTPKTDTPTAEAPKSN